MSVVLVKVKPLQGTKPVQSHYTPSSRMVQKFGSHNAAVAHAQDLILILEKDNCLTLAVIDAASNFIGQTEYGHPISAEQRQVEGMLNGGEIASSVLRTAISNNTDLVGVALIQSLNEALAATYKDLGIEVNLSRRGELFTGYVAVARITANGVTITSVGDCYVAINGTAIAGVEKEIDSFHASLVDRVADGYGIPRQEAYEMLMPTLNTKQFEYQNEPLTKLWYPAIDGTMTPAEGINCKTVDRSSVNSIVMWTDGYRPRCNKSVVSLDDLTPANPFYGEQTAIIATNLLP